MKIYRIEREQQILRLLQEKGAVSVTELTGRFNLAKETVRRDLNRLEKSGVVTRTHGGAVMRTNAANDQPLRERAGAHDEEKRALCRRAAGYIESGDTIFIDISSTTLHIIDFIPPEAQVTVLTNSLEVANEYLRSEGENITLLCAGGVVRRINRSLTGYFAQHVLREFIPTKAFFSCYGLSFSDGFTEGSIYESEIKRLVVQRAHRSFFLLDHWKIGEVGPVRLGPIDIADTLLVDSGVDSATLGQLRLHAKDTIVVDE